MEIFGGCHQGKERQLHIRMTVLWLPVGKAKVSRAPDFSLLIISVTRQATEAQTAPVSSGLSWHQGHVTGPHQEHGWRGETCLHGPAQYCQGFRAESWRGN